jgi:hypothetical protein
MFLTLNDLKLILATLILCGLLAILLHWYGRENDSP